MKKLYRKGVVHPTLPAISDKYLSFLPAAILTLTVGLCAEEREVLAYLISRSSSSSNKPTNKKASSNLINPRKKNPTSNNIIASNGNSNDTITKEQQHPTCFSCDCFSCYMSYWAKWDSSPNRHLIHDIIDAFEDWLAAQRKPNQNKIARKRKEVLPGGNDNNACATSKALVNQSSVSSGGLGNNDELKTQLGEPAARDSEDGSGNEAGDVKGPVRRLVSLIGERVFGVWGQ